MADSQEDSGPALISKRSVALIVSAILLIAGIILAVTNYRLGIRWASDGPQSGYFPFGLSVLLCIASVIGLVDAWRMDRDKAFVHRAEFGRVLRVLLPTLLFVAVALTMGIYLAAALFIFGFMTVIGHSRIATSAIVAVVFSAILFWVFEIQFLVPLPKGPVEALFGY